MLETFAIDVKPNKVTIKNKKGIIINSYIYQDIDENGEYIEGGQLWN